MGCIQSTYSWTSSPLAHLKGWLQAQGEELQTSVKESIPEEGEEGKRGFTVAITVYYEATQVSEYSSSSGETRVVGKGWGQSKRAAMDAAARDTCEQLQLLGAFHVAEAEVLPRKRVKDREESEGEDSFYDRTSKQKAKVPRLETAESLYAQEHQCMAALERLTSELCAAQEASMAANQVDDDDIDAVMHEAGQAGARKDVARLQPQVLELGTRLQRFRVLLSVADPMGKLRPASKEPSVQVGPSVNEAESCSDGAPEDADEPIEENATEHQQEEEDFPDWLPPKQAESQRALDLKAKYGY